ncbi:MAG: sugar transferase [Tabrizicola sp.]|uniref:sugar transferase n=1 Tax=Tabrizicola sp. TaxID=2005166 RepID=UPI002ABBE609|nr:sugar transferase [Tabrizicola sp.]MDZ4089107.1 sugar transferase [Tabrizicola sp.]
MDVRSELSEPNFERPSITVGQGWVRVRKEPLYRRVLKRWMDVVLVVMVAPFVVPVVLILALVLKLTGHSPFFFQDRVGKDGRIFKLWKLRTMVPDADARLRAYLQSDEAARQEWDSFQKLSSDPRITEFGQFLRKSSLDELPQLWNVLIGDMSLVGPRPMMVDQQELYPGNAYYALRPGLTGTWQISDRNQSTFAQRADFDAEYERNLTFFKDLKILLATVGVVLRATGK